MLEIEAGILLLDIAQCCRRALGASFKPFDDVSRERQERALLNLSDEFRNLISVWRHFDLEISRPVDGSTEAFGLP